uniref:Uncharacterized protein n=1 Tax=Cajanus cajan TaxID=3821 RepID=A0A151TRF2_CAJCA|nr:hypothetical protein KK1_008839 [Cajanus cajan]
MILDASFGGSVMFRTVEEAITIIESMASTDFRSQHGRSIKYCITSTNANPLHVVCKKRVINRHRNGPIDVAQTPLLKHPEKTSTIAIINNTPYKSNEFRLGWRNNNAQFGGKQDMGASSSRLHPPQQQHPPLYERTTKLEDTLQQFMQLSLQNQKNTDASIKNLEVQVGQLAKQLADQKSGS